MPGRAPNGHLMIFFVVVGYACGSARAPTVDMYVQTITLISEEGAIMSPVLPTYVAGIIHDLFLMSAGHSRILCRHFISKVATFFLDFG